MNKKKPHALDQSRDAHFSGDLKYRYRLERIWDSTKPLGAFIGLNPSIANASEDDPTIRKCRGFALQFGWGGFYMLNLFAYVATKPKDLKLASWPTGGAKADQVIERTLTIVEAHRGEAICCWGTNGVKAAPRTHALLAMIRDAGLRPRVLALNGDGTPAHPLMLAYGNKTEPMEW